MKKTLLATITLFALTPITSMSEENVGKALNAGEIKQLFSNTSAVCLKEKDKSSCVTYMGSAGQVKRLTHKDNKIRNGNWHADGQDRLCIRWEGKEKDLCFKVSALPNKTYQLHKKGKLKSTIIGFMPGDTIGDYQGE